MAKFVRSHAETEDIIKQGLSQYVDEVKTGAFAAEEHRFTMKEEELQ